MLRFQHGLEIREKSAAVHLPQRSTRPTPRLDDLGAGSELLPDIGEEIVDTPLLREEGPGGCRVDVGNDVVVQSIVGECCRDHLCEALSVFCASHSGCEARGCH